jgi:hypothetical protein
VDEEAVEGVSIIMSSSHLYQHHSSSSRSSRGDTHRHTHTTDRNSKEEEVVVGGVVFCPRRAGRCGGEAEARPRIVMGRMIFTSLIDRLIN